MSCGFSCFVLFFTTHPPGFVYDDLFLTDYVFALQTPAQFGTIAVELAHPSWLAPAEVRTEARAHVPPTSEIEQSGSDAISTTTTTALAFLSQPGALT